MQCRAHNRNAQDRLREDLLLFGDSVFRPPYLRLRDSSTLVRLDHQEEHFRVREEYVRGSARRLCYIDNVIYDMSFVRMPLF